jgi:2-dehydro-3-deoxyphosphooctonate aldolase (KDO 8-P synthase)
MSRLDGRPIFIAGPCAIEGADWFVDWTGKLVTLFESYPQFQFVLKGSYDKANRTRGDSPRGCGFNEATTAWAQIRKQWPNLPILTDVHESYDVYPVSRLVDIIQIPAFLGRQTDLLEAAGDYAGAVNVKIPQWEEPETYAAAAKEKIGLTKTTFFTYRGSFCGMTKDVVVDPIRLLNLGREASRVVLDITHTNRKSMFNSLALASLGRAIAIPNYFAEVHPHPEKAVCDADHQLTKEWLTVILDEMGAHVSPL